uniref:Uncharacterized protein n=1 Tax=Romanomermis culicivorax TaxID=13658 RepID=A0A915IIU7_ROMCU
MIRYLASKAFMQVVGDAHGPHKSTVSCKVHKVVNILNNFYFDNVVKFPEDFATVAHRFYKIARFPCVVGCIDEPPDFGEILAALEQEVVDLKLCVNYKYG